MAGGRGKKKHVDPAEVERLARKGHLQNSIATELGVSNDTYYERIKENPDIAEAYKKGREAFLEFIRKTRSERVLEALDDLIMQRNPAAVIFASKTILGLQEHIQLNHSAVRETLTSEERLKELEQKRQALTAAVVDVVSAKEPDTI
jgi:transposase